MSRLCFACQGAILDGEAAFEIALGHFPPDMSVFVPETDPPPRVGHARCLNILEILLPMKEIMQRYVGQEITVKFHGWPQITGNLVAAGETAFTILDDNIEISRPYNEVHEVTAAPPAPPPLPPESLREPAA